jgi:hypothetical protein
MPADVNASKKEIMGVFFRRAAYEHICSLRFLKGFRSIFLSLVYNPFQVFDSGLWFKFIRN